jgi:hypothetical protein
MMANAARYAAATLNEAGDEIKVVKGVLDAALQARAETGRVRSFS